MGHFKILRSPTISLTHLCFLGLSSPFSLRRSSPHGKASPPPRTFVVGSTLTFSVLPCPSDESLVHPRCSCLCFPAQSVVGTLRSSTLVASPSPHLIAPSCRTTASLAVGTRRSAWTVGFHFGYPPMSLWASSPATSTAREHPRASSVV